MPARPQGRAQSEAQPFAVQGELAGRMPGELSAASRAPSARPLHLQVDLHRDTQPLGSFSERTPTPFKDGAYGLADGRLF